MLKIIDLFSGCGGLSLGFQNAGFEILAAFDNWTPAINTYQANFHHDAIQLDLSDEGVIEILSAYNPEMIIGGPPCQDFSSAGKRNEETQRADLTIKFSEIVAAIKPKVFIMENVGRISVTNTLKKSKIIFQENGYGLSEVILNASLCGVPQARKRFFLIGILNEQDQVLEPCLHQNLSTTPLSVFEYLGHDLNIEHYYRHPRNYSRRAIFSIYESCPTIRGVNRPIPKTYQFHANDTITDLTKVRVLTAIERSYLQTFPKSFIFPMNNKTDLEQMIGNAVPVKLAEYVAKAVTSYLQEKEIIRRIIPNNDVMSKQLSFF